MKTQFVTIGMLIAALATATAFADDAQNGQMGQNQAGAAPSAQQSPAQQPPVDPSAAGNPDTTTTTTTTTNPSSAMPSQNSN